MEFTSLCLSAYPEHDEKYTVDQQPKMEPVLHFPSAIVHHQANTNEKFWTCFVCLLLRKHPLTLLHPSATS